MCPVTLLKDTKAADFDSKKEFTKKAACDPVKLCRKPPETSKFGAFSLQPMRGRHWRTSTNHGERNSEESISNHF
jgi:hypothetical protein